LRSQEITKLPVAVATPAAFQALLA